MKTIAFANNKGGVGKTTMSLTIAAELAKYGKTCLIDTDPQGNSGASLLKEKPESTLSDVLNSIVSIDEAIEKTEIENLFVITDNPVSPNLRRYIQSIAPTEPEVFGDFNSELEALGFDYAVYDTAPSFSLFEENIFKYTDIVVPVLLLDQYSLSGLATFTENILNYKKRKKTEKPEMKEIILNQFDNRLNLSKSIVKEIEKRGYEFFVVPTDQNFKKCSTAKLAAQYVKDTKKETLEVIKRIGESLK